MSRYKELLLEYTSRIVDLLDVEPVDIYDYYKHIDTCNFIKLTHNLNNVIEKVVINDIMLHNKEYRVMIEYIYDISISKHVDIVDNRSLQILWRLPKARISFICDTFDRCGGSLDIRIAHILEDQYNKINEIEWLEEVEILIANDKVHISTAAILLCEYQQLLSVYSKKNILTWYTQGILHALKYKNGVKLRNSAHMIFIKFYAFDLINDINLLAHLIQYSSDQIMIVSLTNYLSYMMNMLS